MNSHEVVTVTLLTTDVIRRVDRYEVSVGMASSTVLNTLFTHGSLMAILAVSFLSVFRLMMELRNVSVYLLRSHLGNIRDMTILAVSGSIDVSRYAERLRISQLLGWIVVTPKALSIYEPDSLS